MDGVFMLRLLKKVMILALIGAVIYGVFLIRDRKTLNDQILRLHVVGETNTAEDQQIKVRVKDALLEKLRELTADADTKEKAQALLSDNLSLLQETANEILRSCGVSAQASVTLKQEAFPTRVYETFTLPAGVYDSLRVVIGEGQGRNWWCVVFPSLCVPAASQEVEDVAASAGFSEGLGKSLTGEEGYEIRFFLLDALGQLQNFFFQG